MSIRLNGETFFRTAEACQMAGISRATLFRWFSEGIVADTIRKDRKGWRLFSVQDVAMIKAEVDRTI